MDKQAANGKSAMPGFWLALGLMGWPGLLCGQQCDKSYQEKYQKYERMADSVLSSLTNNADSMYVLGVMAGFSRTQDCDPTLIPTLAELREQIDKDHAAAQRKSNRDRVADTDSLVALDSVLAAAYRRALDAQTDANEARSLRLAQRLWLRTRDKACGTNTFDTGLAAVTEQAPKACLRRQLLDRIAALTDGLDTPKTDPSCASVASSTTWAHVRRDSTQLISRKYGKPTVAGRLDPSDLLVIARHRGDSAFVRAPITDDTTTYLVRVADLCRLENPPPLSKELFPVATRSFVDDRLRGLMAQSGVPAGDIAGSNGVDTQIRDMGGNGRRVEFRVAKFYSQRGRPMYNLTGWYDRVGVHYFSFEEGSSEPDDHGTGTTLEIRQGHDPLSRNLLLLRDPGGYRFPFVVYAGSNDFSKTMYAYIPTLGGQWVSYDCSGSRMRVHKYSSLSYEGVGSVLLSIARGVCAGKVPDK